MVTELNNIFKQTVKIMIDINKDKYTKEDLIKHYESGKTTKQVAKIYGVSANTIRARNKIYGINIRDYTDFGRLKNVTKEELIEKYSSGLSIAKLAKEYKVDKDAIRNKNKEFGINIEDYYDCRANYDIHIFDVIDTEEKAYWLGFLFADGCVRGDSNSVGFSGISIIDINHIRKFKQFLNDTRPDSVIKTYKNVVPYTGNVIISCGYYICNANIKQNLVNFGCVPRKSLILKFPDPSIFKSENLVYDFIRGYNDGDGCLSKVNHNRLAISMRGTFEFLSGVISYFPEEFKKVYSEIDKRTGSLQYKISCGSNKADRVAMKLYNNATVYLDRKFNIFATLCRLYTSEKSGKNGEG